MTLTQLIRNLESQLKSAEKLTQKYDTEADALRNKLAEIANAVGKGIAARVGTNNRKSKSSSRKSSSRKKRRTLSPKGRARIIAAQRKRWAKVRSNKKSTQKPAAKKGRRRLSPEGRARIIAAQRKRWAAAKKTAAPKAAASK